MTNPNSPKDRDFLYDLLDGGVRDTYYISKNKPDTVYRVQVIVKKGKKCFVRAVEYTVNGEKKSNRFSRFSIIECLDDERAPTSFKADRW